MYTPPVEDTPTPPPHTQAGFKKLPAVNNGRISNSSIRQTSCDKSPSHGKTCAFINRLDQYLVRSGLHRPAAFSHSCQCYQLPPLFSVLCNVTQCHSLPSWSFDQCTLDCISASFSLLSINVMAYSTCILLTHQLKHLHLSLY